MRALTLRQPWAWAIIHGGKDVENRTRDFTGGYRGPVAIHAGLQVDAEAAIDPLIVDALRQPTGGLPFQPLGAFIGVVDLVGVHWCCDDHHECCRPWGQHDYDEVEVRRLCDPRADTARQPTVLHLVLANPRPLPEPVPARGMLGLWTPAAEVLEALQAAV